MLVVVVVGAHPVPSAHNFKDAVFGGEPGKANKQYFNLLFQEQPKTVKCK